MKAEDITQAKAQYEKVAAVVENAKTQLGYATVIAPSSGVVVKKYVEKGSIVAAGRSSFAGTGSGVTIVDIAEIDRMLVQVGVDETDIAQIKIGQRVDVSVDAFPGQKFKGKVTKIAPEAVVDQSVTTVPVTVEVMQPDKKLKPEMNATCDFIVISKENILTVPSEAVRETDRGSVVTVIENGKSVERSVKTGIVGSDTTEIISGLKEGETVVTSLVQPQTAGGTGQGQGAGGSGAQVGGKRMRGGPPPPF
jgi:HlyD family secretion protein